MRKLAIAIGVLVALLLAVLFIVPSLVPSEIYKSRLQAQLSEELGREVVMDGDVRLSTFPLIKARTDSVRVANPDGFGSADFIALDGLEARIRLLPLFRKQVEISRFTLIRPVIMLERRADGEVNWALGEDDAQVAPTGPFRRDGRYTNIDPQITAFNIEDGTLRYSDALNDQSVELAAINAFLSMPGLASELVIDGSATLDGAPVALDLRMDSPADFLNGLETKIDLDAKIDGASVVARGVLPPGEEPAFSGTVKGDVPDLGALRRWLPDLGDNARYLDAVKTTRFDGAVDASTDRIALSDATLRVVGPALTASFDGSGAYDEMLTLDGRVDADLTDVQALAKLLPEPVEGIDLLRTAKVTANMRALEGGSGFAIRDAVANATGDGLYGEFRGSGTFSEVLSLKGTFSADVAKPQALAARFAPDFTQEAGIAGTVNAAGQLDYSPSRIRVTDLVATANSGLQSSRYEGGLTYTDTLSLDGRVTANVPDAAALNARLSKPVEGLQALGTVDVSAVLSGPQTALAANDIVAELSGGAVNGRYDGTVRLGDVPTLDGRFQAEIPSLQALDARLPQDIPYADAIGRIAASGTVSGTPDDLTLGALDAAMTDGQLNGSYKGPVRYSGGVATLDGALDVNGPSLRALAAKSGTVLPPSSDTGAVFERFALSGRVGGTTRALTLSDAQIALDQLTASGRFGVDLQGAKPKLTGTITAPELDLRPYMAAYSAQNPTGEIQPWSTQPIPAESLRGFDAEFAMTTDAVRLTRMRLDKTVMNVTVVDGRLTADVPSLGLYGGTGRGRFVLDGSGAVPTVDITANLGALDSQGFLGAVAGFAKATGTAGTEVSLRGAGRSQADIMRSLTGAGDFKVVNGSIQGIDAGEFLTGLETALSSRRLPGGIGAGKVTQFRDLLGAFKVENGVATIDRFSLDALGVSAEGQGRIDLGGQSLDFRFRPRATGEQARGLAAFGVPIRFSGGFGSASASLDTEFLGQIAAERVRQEAAGAIRKGIGGKAGDIIGGIVGGGTAPGGTQPAPDGTTPPAPSTDPDPATTPNPAPTRDVPRDIIGGLLGGGSKPKPTDQPTETPADPPAEPEPEPEAEPETVEDAVLDLFGIRPKKDKN